MTVERGVEDSSYNETKYLENVEKVLSFHVLHSEHFKQDKYIGTLALQHFSISCDILVSNRVLASKQGLPC